MTVSPSKSRSVGGQGRPAAPAENTYHARQASSGVFLWCGTMIELLEAVFLISLVLSLLPDCPEMACFSFGTLWYGCPTWSSAGSC